MTSRTLKIIIAIGAFFLVAAISFYLTIIVVIKSEDPISVPNLVGKDIVDTLEILTQMGLNTKFKATEYSLDIPKNHVIFQDPFAGSIIKKGRDVQLIFSKGPEMIKVPELTSLSIDQARISLEQRGLTQGTIARMHKSETTKMAVIAQYPVAGTIVSQRTGVDLLLSLGSRTKYYKMPSLTGLKLEDALLNIAHAKLTKGTLSPSFEKGFLLNTVLNQMPLPGQKVSEGYPIDLTVNAKNDHNWHAAETRQTKSTFFRYRTKGGFLKRHIRIVAEKDQSPEVFFDALVAPTEEIWLFIPSNFMQTLRLYEDQALINIDARFQFGSNWP